jgi:hypothetical protein
MSRVPAVMLEFVGPVESAGRLLEGPPPLQAGRILSSSSLRANVAVVVVAAACRSLTSAQSRNETAHLAHITISIRLVPLRLVLARPAPAL